MLLRSSWWITIAILVVFAGLYTWLFIFTRKRQKSFDNQYNAAKERHEVFVLNKKISRERSQNRFMRFARFKTYQVIGRISVSQKVKGVQMSRMQTVTFQTTKAEFDKIQVNHKYKMDIAGNYIGFVIAPIASKSKSGKNAQPSSKGKGLLSRFRRKTQ